jgi:hypothetical protein
MQSPLFSLVVLMMLSVLPFAFPLLPSLIVDPVIVECTILSQAPVPRGNMSMMHDEQDCYLEFSLPLLSILPLSFSAATVTSQPGTNGHIKDSTRQVTSLNSAVRLQLLRLIYHGRPVSDCFSRPAVSISRRRLRCQVDCALSPPAIKRTASKTQQHHKRERC